MSKTLSTILTIFKVVKIVSEVVFILCIVGAAGCLIALVALPFASAPALFIEGEQAIAALSYPACLIGLISCAGGAIFAFLAKRYFGRVLSVGDPFTLDSAKEIFRLGIASIIISAAQAVSAEIILGIFLLISPGAEAYDVDFSISLTTGLFFLFLSLLFKYGAELKSTASPSAEQEKPSSDA